MPRETWEFKGADTRYWLHGLHSYPAIMIPQIAARLFAKYGARATQVFDPYCGTGTSLLEANIRGLSAAGTDLNPLARLIAQVKTTPLDCSRLAAAITTVTTRAPRRRGAPRPGYKNIDYWFSPQTQEQLAALRAEIATIAGPAYQRFLYVIFSETVRECSYTRNKEFKLFRLPPAQLAGFAPQVFDIFARKAARNLALMAEYRKQVKKPGRARIYDFNTVTTPPAVWPIRTFDFVVTSPPYGDSKTTVAYGQFSRLANEWLEVPAAQSIDRALMGGAPAAAEGDVKCPALTTALTTIANANPRRAAELRGFYVDYEKSIKNIAQAMPGGGRVCYVVGNRRSAGVTLPTARATEAYFTAYGFRRVALHTRSIPNKRMPRINSPSNIPGQQATTMDSEYIIIMEKL